MPDALLVLPTLRRSTSLLVDPSTQLSGCLLAHAPVCSLACSFAPLLARRLFLLLTRSIVCLTAHSLCVRRLLCLHTGTGPAILVAAVRLVPFLPAGSPILPYRPHMHTCLATHLSVALLGIFLAHPSCFSLVRCICTHGLSFACSCCVRRAVHVVRASGGCMCKCLHLPATAHSGCGERLELRVPFARTAGEFVGRKTEEKTVRQ